MIVLDASALVDVVLDQPDKPWVLDQIDGASLAAPAHQLAEVLSAVARLVRAGTIDEDTARAAVGDAQALEQELVAPTAEHLDFALRHQDEIRVLDGLYAALSVDRDWPLVTTDRRLARTEVPCEVFVPPK